jgi:hypothetical protein
MNLSADGARLVSKADINLPTDQEYLAYLLDLWGSPRDDAIRAHTAKHHPEWLDDIDPELASDFRSSETFSQGQLAKSLQATALYMAGPARLKVENVPVAFLPHEDVNACAVRTPRDGAVILLNTAILDLFPIVCQCVSGILSEEMRGEMFPSLTSLDCAQSLYWLAREAVSPDIGLGRRARFFNDPEVHEKVIDPSFPLTQRVESQFLLMEYFILLHEYGHIVLGHLDTKRVRLARAATGVEIYTNSQTQEFDADAFALECLFRHLELKDRWRVYVFLGTLFGFFRLLEAVSDEAHSASTHPPTPARWARLRELASQGQERVFPNRSAQVFDEIVAAVRPTWQPMEPDLTA